MKSNTQIANDVNEAKYKSRRAATSPWMIRLARLGYTVKGIVYVVIGWLAVMVAIGHGGKATDQSGAIQTINSLPLGKFLLVVVAIGLLGFALWSFIQALFDTEGKGRDAKGIASRIGYAVVGASYALLSYGYRERWKQFYKQNTRLDGTTTETAARYCPGDNRRHRCSGRRRLPVR